MYTYTVQSSKNRFNLLNIFRASTRKNMCRNEQKNTFIIIIINNIFTKYITNNKIHFE